jgi:biotin carboxylase
MTPIRLYPRPGDQGPPHVVVINRWQERYAEYASYLDHDAHAVTYVTTEVGQTSVPAGAAEVVLVERTDDFSAVRAAVRSLVARYGKPAGVVALKEDDLLVGALLRQEWDVAGQRPDELTVFRDKYVMCQAVQRGGIPVPPFALAPDRRAVSDFAAKYGWPIIVKPTVGSSSSGVEKVDDPTGLDALRLGAEPVLVQQYRPEPIYHVDGVFDARRLLTWRASRYINTCLGFRSGGFLGSVEVDDPRLNRAIGRATEEFIAALTGHPVVFHLEIFVGEDADGAPRCSFLEVGARTGGAEIPFVWREVHGYDLMEAALRIQLCQDPPAPTMATPSPDPVAGWLLVPAPVARPCRVTAATPMVGRRPGPYAEAVLRPGDVIPAADAYYEHVGGRFRFRGPSSVDVEGAIIATARGFRVAGEPFPPASAAVESQGDRRVPVESVSR